MKFRVYNFKTGEHIGFYETWAAAKHRACMDEYLYISKNCNYMENVTNAPHSGTTKKIVVNGKNVDWRHETMSYDQLFGIAYPSITTVMDFSAAYEYPKNIDKRGKTFCNRIW